MPHQLLGSGEELAGSAVLSAWVRPLSSESMGMGGPNARLGVHTDLRLAHCHSWAIMCNTNSGLTLSQRLPDISRPLYCESS